MDKNNYIEKEIKGCFDFFYNESNLVDGEIGYGLTLDKTGDETASIAAVGFALASYVIGVEHKYISFERGKEISLKTIQTITNNIAHYKGFLIHFCNQKTAKNTNSEYSTIDTSIFLMGAITAASYFKGELTKAVDDLVSRVDWEEFITVQNGKKVLYMAYNKDLYKTPNGFSYADWDHYAEQLMMYILYAGKDNSDVSLAKQLYAGFERHVGAYKSNNMVYCYGNPLFVHQFTHCFFDFRKYVDEFGFDWFANSIEATIANRAYCIDQNQFKTYSASSWGLTACQTNKGYRVYGAPPHGFSENPYDIKTDGTVSPYASLSSMPFTPKYSNEALNYFNSIKNLNGKYGLYDSYNFEEKEDICKCYLGIDKGPTIVMLDNYLNGTVWKYFMESKYAKRAIKVLGFQTKRFENYKK